MILTPNAPNRMADETPRFIARLNLKDFRTSLPGGELRKAGVSLFVSEIGEDLKKARAAFAAWGGSIAFLVLDPFLAASVDAVIPAEQLLVFSQTPALHTSSVQATPSSQSPSSTHGGAGI